MSQKYNSEYINELEAFFIGRNDNINRLGNVISHYLTLPGLIGFWPMATVQRSTGNVPNYAPTFTGATKQDLVYNGNPVFNATTAGVPYIDLDGTGDYLSINDNTDLDVLGTETQYANPGMTVLIWTYVDATSVNNQVIVSKNTGVANRTFIIYFLRSGLGSIVQGQIFDAADNNYNANSSFSFDTATWIFIALRFTPSSELRLWYNNNEFVNTTSIPAALQNSTSQFCIGAASGGTSLLSGRETLCSYHAVALPSSIITSVFQQTRALFGV